MLKVKLDTDGTISQFDLGDFLNSIQNIKKI
jgi:hypothetical protein